MKIILFSDIHANLPALQAFFDEIDKEDADVIYCLGDLVGYNSWPNEVIAEIRKRRIPTIAGNYDYGVGKGSDDCGCAYKTEEERGMGQISISYTNSIIGKEEREYLNSLPRHIRIDFVRKGEKENLLLVHGSPRKINEYLFEDREEKSLFRIIKDAGATILCFGHTHKPFHRVVKGEEGEELHAINTGSVGKPKDDDPRGCYVLLTIEEEIKVEFRRFEYDIEKACKGVEDSPLPNGYAQMLRKGV